MPKSDRRQLTPDDWAQAALDAIARGGIDAVAVEPLAAELGATKGSFYWHFDSRDALIEAVLGRWEQQRTDAVIELLEKQPDPARRLGLLLAGGFARDLIDLAEVALLANPNHPSAVRAVRRVSERRIRYLAHQLEALGWEPPDARDRAVLLAYLYVGHLQLAHLAPEVIDEDGRQRRMQLVFDALIARDPAAGDSPPDGREAAHA